MENDCIMIDVLERQKSNSRFLSRSTFTDYHHQFQPFPCTWPSRDESLEAPPVGYVRDCSTSSSELSMKSHLKPTTLKANPNQKLQKFITKFSQKFSKFFLSSLIFRIFSLWSKRYYLHQFCSLAPKSKNIKNLNMRTEINYDFCRLLWMLKKELLLRLKWSWREWRWNPLGQESGQCRYLSFRTISLLC